MQRELLLAYLEGEACEIDDDGCFDSGCICRNCINGLVCVIPNGDEIYTVTCFAIFFSLRVPAPYEMEDDYEIYKLFLQNDLKIEQPEG